MKNMLIALLAVLTLASGSAAAQSARIEIVPKPAEIVAFENQAVYKDPVLVWLDPQAGLDRNYVEQTLRETGFSPIFVDKRKKADLVFRLNKTPLNNDDEAYRLAVQSPDSKKQIVARADAKEGLLYALQTLRQLAQQENGTVVVPSCVITDAPAFPWRAFMLDESRHFHGMAAVKDLLDEMARLKLNTFHWHLVDDPGWRIEIKKYPLLTERGSKRDFSHMDITPEGWDSLHPERTYYTQDEIREVVRYAADRGIRIIPEIEVPGHASASILAYPWIGSTSRREGKAVTGDLYNVTDPKVEAFLHDILDEVIGLFPSKIVHIGGDEANYVHWKNSPEIMAFMKENGLPTCTDLQVWAINRMSKYLASKGCRMIGWNEITGETVREGIQASQSEQLAPGTIVQFWDGDVSLVNKAIAKGYDVVNSNRFFTYVDYAYEVTPFEKAYSFDPIPEGLAEKDKKKILGLGCQMWGEYTPTLERVYYQTYPRIAAFAESGWTAPEKKSYPDFRKRLKKIEAIWKEKGYIKTQKRSAPQTIGGADLLSVSFRRTFADKRVRMLPTSRKVVSSRNFHDGRAYSATVSRNRAGIAATVT